MGGGIELGNGKADVSSTGLSRRGRGKSRQAFRTISEVAGHLDLPQHVLRFWEPKFPQISPMKRGGGRRYYRPEDVEVLSRIKSLLHEEGYTIKGVQKLLKKPGGISASGIMDKADASPKEASSAGSAGATGETEAVKIDGISRNQAESLLSELVAVRDGLKKFS